MTAWLKTLLFFEICLGICECYKILFLYQVPAGSHNILASKLAKEIAKKGHEVTFVTPFTSQTPVKNIKEIPVESLQKLLNSGAMFNMESASPVEKADFVMNISYTFTQHLIQSEQIQNLLKSNEYFDAVLIYQYLNDALLGIARHFKAPTILFSSMPMYASESFLLAHPTPPSYVPNILVEYTGRMNFWQRLKQTYFDTAIILHYLWNYLPLHRELVFKHIPGKPDLYNFLNNASLALINSHVSTNEAVPLVPNAIEIGGYHIEEPKPLPKDLQTWLDGSTNGVILFSMGSFIRSSDFPEEKRNVILKIFEKLKQNVLWKWETDKVSNLPKNVKIMKWIPVSDVLAHPNVKAFISHGGLLSTMESIYHAVPIVGIPIFVDQKMNINYAVSNGYAVAVSYQEITEETLSSALNEVLNNPKYKDNIRKRSVIFKDRNIKPVDNALYWIEYVIRHQGAPHLRYPGMELTWFQRNLLDIVAFVLVVAFTVLSAIFFILKQILKRGNKEQNKRKKNN